jgi:hypothetical protein
MNKECYQSHAMLVWTVVDAPRTGRPISVTTEEIILGVGQAVVQIPWKLTQKAAEELSCSWRLVQHILHCSGFKCYIPRLVHGLIENDTCRRLESCELFQNECHCCPDTVVKIICSYEAILRLAGHVNRLYSLLQHLRFSWWWRFKSRSSGLWCHIVLQ